MHSCVEALAWLALLGTAHVFFGNLYEALVYVPNMWPLFELKHRDQAPMFARKRHSPVIYYVPIAALWVAAAVAAAIAGEVLDVPGRNWLLLGAGLWLVAAGLTGYVVAKINLDLFFKPQTDLARAERMLRRWLRLNVVRMVALSGSAAAWVVGLHDLLRR